MFKEQILLRQNYPQKKEFCQMVNETPVQQAFKPLSINQLILLDPNLTDQEVRIILICHAKRVEISAIEDPIQRAEALRNIKASYFSAVTGKSRDHIRKLFRSMGNNEHVRKWITFYFVKDGLNEEHQIILHFHDNMINNFGIGFADNKEIKKEYGLERLTWTDETLLKSYLKDSKAFQGYSPIELMKLVNVKASELVKGLVYVEAMTRRTKINNVIGYLVKSFDEKGLFRYDTTPKRYLPIDTYIKSTDNFEVELEKKWFGIFERSLNNKFNNSITIMKREAGENILVKEIYKAGRKLNLLRQIKSFDIPFKIVDDLERGAK